MTGMMEGFLGCENVDFGNIFGKENFGKHVLSSVKLSVLVSLDILGHSSKAKAFMSFGFKLLFTCTIIRADVFS